MDQTLRTRAVRAGIDSDTAFGAVIAPLHLSSNFSFAGFDQPRTYDYTRSGNPTRDAFAGALAELEGGSEAIVTASGMAAIALVLQLLKPEDTLLVPHDCYGGSHRLFRAWAQQGRFKLAEADLTDPVALAQALADPVRMVWVETPSNPLLRITDLRHVCACAHRVGALVVADNTFLSPALQRPISLGADVVVHSTTKYVNGHSDVVGGAVVVADAAVAESLRWWANCIGLAGAPFDSYLAMRGLRTLALRMQAHEDNAAVLADFLDAHPAVARVHYPGLREHPGHALARRQQSGFGGMLSFELSAGAAAIPGLLEGLACFTLAESLGGVESLIAHPATMTHAAMSAGAREAAGIGGGLLRVSVGIEDIADLVTDLDAALNRSLGLPGRVEVAR